MLRLPYESVSFGAEKPGVTLVSCAAGSALGHAMGCPGQPRRARPRYAGNRTLDLIAVYD